MADVIEDVPFTDPAAAISQGKRHLLVRDYTAAVTAFAEGLELLSQKHGDCGDELGEPYLLYGRALLGLAREEAGVLGDGVPGTEEGDEDVDDDEDDDENATDEKDASSTDKKTNDNDKSKDDKESEIKKIVNDKKEEKIDDKKEEKIDEKKEEKVNDKKDVKADEKKEVKVDDKKEVKVDDKNEVKADEKKEEKVDVKEDESLPGSSKDESVGNDDNCSTVANGGDDIDDVEDVNEDEAGRGIDLQVAWEVLELAKIVFSKRGKDGIKQLAEAHRLLGEVAMESGNPEVAISDLEKALEILETIEPLDPRSIAELNYQLGLAHSLTNEFDKSINHFNQATILLKTRITELEAINHPVKTSDPFYSVEGEISELKELLPEILEKIADMKDFKQEACRLVIEGIKKQAGGSCTNGAGPSSAGASTSTDTTTTTSSSSSSSLSSAPVQSSKPASDISHLVRKKRKNEDSEAETASPCKKPTP